MNTKNYCKNPTGVTKVFFGSVYPKPMRLAFAAVI